MKRIESRQNPIIKEVLRIKKEKNKEPFFLAEGRRFISEIPADWKIAYYIVSESYVQAEKYSQNTPVYQVPDKLYTELCDTIHSQGILAVCGKKQGNIEDFFAYPKKNGFYLYAENVRDPGNLGTIIRTASAAGADAVFLNQGCVNVYHTKVLRATMGAVFHIPIFQKAELAFLCRVLHQQNGLVYAAHLQAETFLYQQNFCTACLFLIGNEADGLTEEAANAADVLVKIPMPGKAESLNASVAAGILLYEAVRQRM